MDDAGAVILGVSPDSVDVLSNWRAEENLQYNLLSDPDHEVADRYGVWGEKAYEGIIRSHFVIDEHGRLEDVQYKVSPEKSVEEALRQITS
jgi:peroxiredoxin Q/BCP